MNTQIGRTSRSTSGSALSIFLIALIGITLLLGVALFGWYVRGYNRAVALDKEVEEAWANVDVQLQRRADLVPNLVETVKGYAEHEQELFTSIAQSREKYFQADTRTGKIEASTELGSFLSRLLMLQERYPDLKANQSFLGLQDQLEGTENRIAVARTRYNEAVKTLNTYAAEMFGSYFCKKAGVEPAKPFEASDKNKIEAPKVEL